MLFSPQDRLRLWDAVAGMHPVDAAVRALAVTRPDLEDPAGLALGERDLALLGLRADLLGDEATARTACPACGEQTTLELSIEQLVRSDPVPDSWTLEHGGRNLRLRALTSRDAAAAARSSSSEEARSALLRAAVVEGDPDQPGAAAAVATSLAEHDSNAEITLACVCPACGESWTELLDVASFVSVEIVHSAGRLLAEVAELAAAFGWSEESIVALPDARRHAYLALAAR
jgi:predicted RNA-binding Zn-ribbon protein involved in translation (DUF1610 family)